MSAAIDRATPEAAARMKGIAVFMTDLFGLAGKKVIRFDGAIGTVLSERIGRGLLSETLLFSRDGIGLVRDLHVEYADAGADIITTNTFAANRIVFEREGIADRKSVV